MEPVELFLCQVVLWPVVRLEPVIQQEVDLALAGLTMFPAPFVEPVEQSPDSLGDR